MSLLTNQLSLSLVELKNNKIDEASQRLKITSETYPQNYILNTNKTISKQISNHKNQNSQSKQNLQRQFISVIQTSPLNYVGYYNLFNLYIKLNKRPDALHTLHECISAMYLYKGLKQKSQTKIVSGLKYCENSILGHLIKAITHIQNQKYVLAINDLNWILNQTYFYIEIQLRRQILIITKSIYQSLGQTSKGQQIDKFLQNLQKSQQNLSNQRNQQRKQKKLTSSYAISPQMPRINSQIQTKLKEFIKLLIQTQQFKSFKKNSNLSQLILKQVNQNDLNKQNLNQVQLIQKLKHSINKSQIYNKSSPVKTQKLSDSNKSQGLSNNASQDLIYSPNSSNFAKTIDFKRDSNRKQNKNISMTNQPVNENIRNSIDGQKGNKQNMSLNNSLNSSMNSSLNTSGIKGKKKTQTIYPLERQGQQVEIKIVMAQLTNNKQVMGKMDPYCSMNYNKTAKKTSVINGGGLEPRWNQSFIFQLSQNPSEMNIQVYDHQTFFRKDDFVGSGKLIVQKNGFVKVAIFQKQKPAGTVFVSIKSKN